MARLAAASSALLLALALRSGDATYSDIADHTSALVKSCIQMRFSAAVRVRVATKCPRTTSGAANVSAADIAKSTLFGVSKLRKNVNIRPTKPSRLSGPKIVVTHRGRVGVWAEAEFILAPYASQSTPNIWPRRTACHLSGSGRNHD